MRERGEEVIQAAVQVAGLLTGVWPLPRREYEVFSAMDNPQVLKYWPARDLKVRGQEWRPDLDEDLGVVHHELDPTHFAVSYETGFPLGKMPATTRELILALARMDLAGEAYREDVEVFLEQIRKKREHEERERNVIAEAGRAVVSQRYARHQQG